MIFGFNSDVQHGAVVYHVQTELRQNETRQNERALETQVFVQGRCAGKLTVFPDRPGLNDLEIHELLRAQHRRVLEAIRAGRITELFPVPEAEPVLNLQWVSAAPDAAEDLLVLRFSLTAGGAAVSGARIHAHFGASSGGPEIAEAQSSADGEVELRLPLSAVASDSSLEVDVSHAERSLTQRFRLRRK